MVPKRVFIVPYRDREQHKAIFLSHMTDIIKRMTNDYEIAFVTHQKDKRQFNRGAYEKYRILFIIKKHIQRIGKILHLYSMMLTIVPYKKLFDYNTIKGT